jgi:hypothetical protein
MSDYRQFGKDPTAPLPAQTAYVSSAPTAANIAQLQAQRLDPPASPASWHPPTHGPRVPSVVPSLIHPTLGPRPTSGPFPTSGLHPTSGPRPRPTLPATALPRPAEGDPQTAALMAEHVRAALRLREEAEQLLDVLQACSAEANAASQRWLSLLHTKRRTPPQMAACAELEAQVLTFSQQLASLRQRWTVCMTQARVHEEAAEAAAR